MNFLRLVGPKPSVFETPSFPTFLKVTVLLICVLLVFKLIQYFFSNKSKENSLDSRNENKVVSPFLIEENLSGEIIFSKKKTSVFVKILIIFLILLLVSRPISSFFSGGFSF